MTRAMEKLILSYAEVRRQYGREEYHRPSRFIRELPTELLDELRAQVYFKRETHSVGSSEAKADFRLGQSVHHPKFGLGLF